MEINWVAARMVLNEQEGQLQLRIPVPLSPSHVTLVAPMNYSVRPAIEIQMLFNVPPLMDVVCRFILCVCPLYRLLLLRFQDLFVWFVFLFSFLFFSYS